MFRNPLRRGEKTMNVREMPASEARDLEELYRSLAEVEAAEQLAELKAHQPPFSRWL